MVGSKQLAKVWQAIAYLNKGDSVWDVMQRIKRFTPEQRQRWIKLQVALYNQFTEQEEDEPYEPFYPDGSTYFSEPEDKGDEGVKPF